MTRLSRHIPLALALTYFLVVATVFLARPGFSSEEAVTALTVEDYLLGLAGRAPPGVERTWLPPNLNSLEGSTLPAVLSVAMGIFGGSVFVFRFVHVLFSLGTLLCVHAVVRRWFDSTAAAVTVGLLAVSSSFLRATRFGDQRDEVLQIFLFWLGLWFFTKFADRKLVRYLLLGALTWGVAFNAKIMAAGYFAGVLVAAPLIAGPAWRLLREVGLLRTVIPAVLAFLVGAAPYLTARLLDFGETAELTRFTLTGSTDSWDNTSLLSNLGHSAGAVLDLLQGQLTADLLVTRFNPYFPFLAAAALLGLALIYATTRPRRGLRAVLFLGVTYAVLLVTTNLHPAKHADPFYVLMLHPLAEVLVGVFASFLIVLIPRRVVGWILAAALVVPTLVAEVVVSADYLHQIRAGRIVGEYDPLIYDVHEALEADETVEVYSLTQFMVYNLYYLSDREMALPIAGGWPKSTKDDKWTAHHWTGDEGVHTQAAVFALHFDQTDAERRDRTRVVVQRSHIPGDEQIWLDEYLALGEEMRARDHRLRLRHEFADDTDPIWYATYEIVPIGSAAPVDGGEVVEPVAHE